MAEPEYRYDAETDKLLRRAHFEKSLRDGVPPAVELLDLQSFHDLAHTEVPEKIPLYVDLLYAGAYLLVGRPKVGKSWFLLQLALAAAEGRAFLGFHCQQPGAVLCIFAEDDAGRIKSRLQAMGYVNLPANIYFITQQDFMTLAKQCSQHMTFEMFLDRWLGGHPDVRYVLIDTETTCRQIWIGERGRADNRRVTETDYAQTRAFDEMALRRNVFIGLVNHAKKKDGESTDIHESINRSNTAFAGCSGSVVLTDYPDHNQLEGESKKRVLGIRGRDLRDDVVLALQQREEDACFEALGVYHEVRQTDTEDEILRTVLELQSEVGGASFIGMDDVAAELGRKTHTIKRAVSRMMEKSERRFWKEYRVQTKRGRGGGIRLDPR